MGVHTEREKKLASLLKSPHLGKESTDEVRVGQRQGTHGVDRTENAGQLLKSQSSRAPEWPQRGHKGGLKAPGSSWPQGMGCGEPKTNQSDYTEAHATSQ